MIDESINFVNKHIREREENGESASDTLSNVQETRYSYAQEANKRFLQIQEDQKRQEKELERQYAELKERFVRFEQEQRQKGENCNNRKPSFSLPNSVLRKHEELLN